MGSARQSGVRALSYRRLRFQPLIIVPDLLVVDDERSLVHRSVLERLRIDSCLQRLGERTVVERVEQPLRLRPRASLREQAIHSYERLLRRPQLRQSVCGCMRRPRWRRGGCSECEDESAARQSGQQHASAGNACVGGGSSSGGDGEAERQHGALGCNALSPRVCQNRMGGPVPPPSAGRFVINAASRVGSQAHLMRSCDRALVRRAPALVCSRSAPRVIALASRGGAQPARLHAAECSEQDRRRQPGTVH